MDNETPQEGEASLLEPLSHEELNAIRQDILDNKEINELRFTAALQTLIAQRGKNVHAATENSKALAAGRRSKARAPLPDLDEFLTQPKPPPKSPSSTS
jgi:hypothetical protein